MSRDRWAATSARWRGRAVGLLVAPLLAVSVGCKDDEPFGSCLRRGDAATGVVASCQDFISPSEDKDALESTCKASADSTWSDAPCNTANNCGYCETDIPDGFHGRYYYFDTKGLKDSEANYEQACLSGGGNTWVDNPNVTCE